MKSGPVYDSLKKGNWREAIRLLKPVAKGNADVCFVIGLIYLDYGPTQASNVKASSWWAKAAKVDHPLSKLYLAYDPLYGLSGPENKSIARRLFEECAEKGSPVAMEKLGEMYLDGVGGFVEEERGLNLLKQAASFPCNGQRLSELRLLDFDSLEDYETAWNADSVAIAQGTLGWIYLDGLDESDTFKTDPVEAEKWLLMAYENGVDEIALDLAEIYLQRKDLEKAKAVLSQAAAKGNANAAFNLAAILEDGTAVDVKDAEKWYQRAARGGNLEAPCALERFLPKENAKTRWVAKYFSQWTIDRFDDGPTAYEQARQYEASGKPDGLTLAARLFAIAEYLNYEPAVEANRQIIEKVGWPAYIRIFNPVA